MGELDEIKEQMTLLTKKLDSLQSSPDDRILQLEKAVNDLKDKYIKLLEEKIEQKKLEVPIMTSNKTALNAPSTDTWHIDNLQLLILLKESRATNKEFAVTASQIGKAFSINRTVKTIRNKFNELEFSGYVDSVGQKPKAFFLTPKGISMLDRQQRLTLEVQPHTNL